MDTHLLEQDLMCPVRSNEILALLSQNLFRFDQDSRQQSLQSLQYEVGKTVTNENKVCCTHRCVYPALLGRPALIHSLKELK